MINRRRDIGFTLLEVILAITLTVGIMACMFALYSSATKTRDRANREMDILLANRLTMEQITRDLRSGMQYQFLQTGMTGTASQAEWVSAQIPGPVSWATQSVFENPHAPETDIQIVGYQLRTGTNQDGDTIIEGLERICQKVLAPTIAEEAEKDEEDTEENSSIFTTRSTAIEKTLLTPHVKFLRFRYWDGLAWQNSWSNIYQPQAVEITLGPEPISDDQNLDEYDGELFQRVVYIPAGAENESAPSGLSSDGGGSS